MRPGPKKGAKYKRRKKLTGKKCATCGKTYSGLLSRGRYCSSRCRDTAAKRRQRRKDLLRRLSWTSDLPDEVLDDLAAITEMASCNDMLGDKPVEGYHPGEQCGGRGDAHPRACTRCANGTRTAWASITVAAS